MRSDTDIKRDVEAELKWAPDVSDTDIAVKVTSGVVTLTGYAASYVEKHHAEMAAKRVLGVTAFANDLAVRAPLDGMPTDSGDCARGGCGPESGAAPCVAQYHAHRQGGTRWFRGIR